VENNITKLKKKQQDLEEAAKKPPPEHGELRTTGSRGPKNQSVAQLIYAENRRKAAEAHRTLAPLGPVVDLPLYHQPSDTVVYLRNRTQFLAFRPRLLKFLRRRQNEKEARNRYLTVTYNKWMNEWAKKVTDLEKISNSNNNAASATAPTEVKSGAVPAAAGAAAVVPPTSVASGAAGQPGVAPNAAAPVVAVSLFCLSLIRVVHKNYKWLYLFRFLERKKNGNFTKKCSRNCASREKIVNVSVESAHG